MKTHEKYLKEQEWKMGSPKPGSSLAEYKRAYSNIFKLIKQIPNALKNHQRNFIGGKKEDWDYVETIQEVESSLEYVLEQLK